MELLLNVFWLMLALPAYWLWWRRAGSARKMGDFGSLRCLLMLGCVLLLLFPVVSATDDLYAMRSEAEESSSTSRTLKDGSADKIQSWLTGAPSLAHSIRTVFCPPVDRVWGQVITESVTGISSSLTNQRSGRAPPLPSLVG